jgi:hypothetical protein
MKTINWDIKMLYRVMLGNHRGDKFYGKVLNKRLDDPVCFAEEMIDIISKGGEPGKKIGCSSPYGKYTEFHYLTDLSDYDWHLIESGMI